MVTHALSFLTCTRKAGWITKASSNSQTVLRRRCGYYMGKSCTSATTIMTAATTKNVEQQTFCLVHKFDEDQKYYRTVIWSPCKQPGLPCRPNHFFRLCTEWKLIFVKQRGEETRKIEPRSTILIQAPILKTTQHQKPANTDFSRRNSYQTVHSCAFTER